MGPSIYDLSSPQKKARKRTRKSTSKRQRKSSHRSSKSSSSNNSKSSSTRTKKEKINFNDYEVLDTVGCGSFAKCSRVRRKSTKEILVWKELSYGAMSNKEKQMLCDEVNILRDLNHPNIVQFVDRIIDHQNRKIFIVQEYCDGGDLASYIKSKRDKEPKMSGRISESFIWSVTSEIASALQHCHNHFNQHKTKKNGKRRILHRDLKPGNVFLVKRRGTYSVKLGDFGLAKMLDASSTFAQTHVGTPYYMSPEQIQSKSYNEKSDIWSLGCIVYEMAMLSPPFKAANYLHLAEKIKLGVFKKVSLRNYSEELDSAIAIMLTVHSKKRAKVEELLCLPRIQFTSKKLRLDRRYCELKKKEHQFNAKMSEFEKKYKKRSLALLEKEKALKLKECELNQKEILLSSKISLTSNTDSRASVSPRHSIPSALSPSTLTVESVDSDKSSKLNAISPTYLHKISTVNTSLTATSSIPEIAEIGGIGQLILSEQKEEESPPRSKVLINDDENSRFCTFDRAKFVLERNDSKESNASIVSGQDGEDIVNDARNFLMKKIEVCDLKNETDLSVFASLSDYNLMERMSRLEIGRNVAAAQSCQDLKQYGNYVPYQS